MRRDISPVLAPLYVEWRTTVPWGNWEHYLRTMQPDTRRRNWKFSRLFLAVAFFGVLFALSTGTLCLSLLRSVREAALEAL
jgi:hypothetical protein